MQEPDPRHDAAPIRQSRSVPGPPLEALCTTTSYRRISRYEDEAILDRMVGRLAIRPGLLDRRRGSTEDRPIFLFGLRHLIEVDWDMHLTPHPPYIVVRVIRF